jgi:hypothetical protein
MNTNSKENAMWNVKQPKFAEAACDKLQTVSYENHHWHIFGYVIDGGDWYYNIRRFDRVTQQFVIKTVEESDLVLNPIKWR